MSSTSTTAVSAPVSLGISSPITLALILRGLLLRLART